MLQLKNLRGQCLTKVQDGTASKLREVNTLRHLLVYLVVGFDLLGIAQRNLLVLILHLTVGDDDAVTVNLKVTLVGVHNHVEVLVRAENLRQHVAEAFFQHAHQSGAIDVLHLFELSEGIDHTLGFFFLCCHLYLFFSYCYSHHTG